MIKPKQPPLSTITPYPFHAKTTKLVSSDISPELRIHGRRLFTRLRSHVQNTRGIPIRKAIMSVNTFNSRSSLKVGNKEYEIYRLDALDQQAISTKHLPYSLRILLENLLRTEDGRNVTRQD